ncbi:hypothetical protein V8C35DRAFT_275237 [Trichoderma chlorosporum]
MTSKILRHERSGRRSKAARFNAKSPASTNIQENVEIPDNSVPSAEKRPSPLSSSSIGNGFSLGAATSAVETSALQSPETIEYSEGTVFFDDGPEDSLAQPDSGLSLFGIINTQEQFPSRPWLDAVCNNEYYFVGIFVDFITSSRHQKCSWVFELPNIMTTTTSTSVKFSIRAAALIYYAVSNHDSGTAVDALHWYLAALESYRMSLHGSSHKSLWDIGAPENSRNASPSSSSLDESGHCSTICVPMMFSYFEQMQGATSDAGLTHLNVACDMLEAIGPYACSFGLYHRMFRSVRSLEAFQAILRNKSARFATADWCQIPFSQGPKGSWDRIVDVAFSFLRQVRLPKANEPASNIRDGVRAIQDLPRKQKLEIEVAANGLMAELVAWWKEYVGEYIAFSSFTRPFGFEDSSISAEPFSLIASSDPFIYGDTHTAGAIALFNAMSIITQHILLLITLSKPPQTYIGESKPAVLALQSSISAQASSILHAARYIRGANSYCGDASRVIFAVKIVSLLALEDDQQAQAQDIANDRPKFPLLSGASIEMRW